MKKDINVKQIIINSVILFVVISVAVIFIYDDSNQNINKIMKKWQKINAKQVIAPSRLYINVWRTAKNEYADKTMNGQNWQRWHYRYIRHIKTFEDANVAIDTMLVSLNDKYTKFLPAFAYTKQKEILDSKITGTGIIFDKTGDKAVINHVLDNTSAQKNNIMPGDVIIGINGKEVSKLTEEEIAQPLESAQGQEVEITIQRDNKIITKKLEVTSLKIKTMEYEITKSNIGIITLANIMGESAINDFIKIINATNNTDLLIIDLRNNYGGILSNALEMANYMLDNEEIVSLNLKGKSNNIHIMAANENKFRKKPIIIIVNKNTASAAEILAGSLKDNIQAIIVGENTFGKNSLQQVIPLNNKSALIITSGKYILPSGQDINNVGITPDIYMETGSMDSEDKIMKKVIQLAQRIVKKNK